MKNATVILAAVLVIGVFPTARYSGSDWSDGFESYTTGSFPSSWIADANATDPSENYVDASVSYEGSKSLRLHDIVGGCWTALAYHPLNVEPPYEVEVVVRNGNESLSGCHPERGYIYIRKGTVSEATSRLLVAFKGDGTIVSSGGTILNSSYSAEAWYTVRVRYERPSSTAVSLSYWINGAYKGDETLSAITEEDQLTNLDITVQEGSAWFDNVSVTTQLTSVEQMSSQLPSNYYMAQNYPNPFNPVTTISYQLPVSEFVNISIYNITG